MCGKKKKIRFSFCQIFFFLSFFFYKIRGILQLLSKMKKTLIPQRQWGGCLAAAYYGGPEIFSLFFLLFRVLMASFFKNFTARLQSKEFRTYLMRYCPPLSAFT